MAQLILVRHAKSQWNDLGQWTGWTDVGLSQEGEAQAADTAEQLRGMKIDKAYVSDLQRCTKTLDIIIEHLGLAIPVVVAPAIKERNYGIFTGKNKWQIKEEIGESEFLKLRRGWNTPIPEGETLQDVYGRVVPYFMQTILPDLEAGKNIIVVAHGNSLRALVKYLENISDEKIADVEIGVGEAHVYELDEKGEVLSKHVRAENADKHKI